MKKCTNCNQIYPDNLRFCSNCGTVLTDANQTNNGTSNFPPNNINNSSFNAQQNCNQNAVINNNPNNGNTYNPNDGSTYNPNNGNTYIPNNGNTYIPNNGNTYIPNNRNPYNPSNTYMGMPNQNSVQEGGFMPWLPMVLAILGLLLDSAILGLFLSIGALVLLLRKEHIYKYPTVAKVISVAGIIVGLGCILLYVYA